MTSSNILDLRDNASDFKEEKDFLGDRPQKQ